VSWALDREERVYRRLGQYIEPWAPRYLRSVRAAGWHGLLLEHVDGARVLPWTAAKARRAARSYASFHARTLGIELPRWLAHTQHRDFSRSWRDLAADSAALDRLTGLAGQRAAEAQAWLRIGLPALRRAEAILARARRPYALLHFDTRSDNIRLQGDLLRLFDWPSASAGPAEFDLAAFAQSIESEGGPDADRVIGWYQQVLPVRADVLLGSVAGVAGYFADRAPRPVVPELPRLRSVQRQQLVASLGWAARLLDLPRAAWLGAGRA
jgi:thiamine kinase-like enzyme